MGEVTRLTNANTVILVVEDESLLRMSAVDMVEDAGFEAVEAANASEAVNILENRFDITLVFTDIDMPGGLDGMKLAACIRDRWPPITIIATSGHVNADKVVLPAKTLFFPKPYRESEIVAAMRRLSIR